jgi:mRNA-degrading endonuclease RelE of RelBE toxin-antitoxin system
MALTLVINARARNSLEKLRGSDPEAFRRAVRLMSALTTNPRPDGAVAWGASGIFRLHAGDLRILYEADEEAGALYVLSVGRVPG